MHLSFRQLGTIFVLALSLARTAHAQEDEDKTPLAKHMSAMNAALKLISGQVEDPAKNASTLEQLAIIETRATEAMGLEPEKMGQIPAAEQAKFVADFQSGIKALLVTVDSLKIAVAAGRNADAVGIVDAMKQQQKEGHGAFRIKKAAPPNFR